jgi:hypothetical protein
VITAEIVEASISPTGKAIYTFALEYPRPIHAELMTHRVFSRNAASSRAIPVAKMLDRVINNPFIPDHWGKNQKGMSADEDLSPEDQEKARKLVLGARDAVLPFVQAMIDLGLHKQVANRYLEPWSHIATLVTSTEWGNWDNLRYHKDAEPHIRDLAKRMYRLRKETTPRLLQYGEWHLPYVLSDERSTLYIEVQKKISAARCSRVSYWNHEGRRPGLEEDLKQFERLMGGFPKHASPTEHQGTPARPSILPSSLCGNFVGWEQFRKFIPGEYMPEFQEPES